MGGVILFRKLLDHHKYAGEIRAESDILRDQIFFMQWCEINTFVVPNYTNPNQLAASIPKFTDSYKSASDNVIPVAHKRLEKQAYPAENPKIINADKIPPLKH